MGFKRLSTVLLVDYSFSTLLHNDFFEKIVFMPIFETAFHNPLF